MKLRCLVPLLLLFGISCLQAEVEFQGLDLSEDNRLLFNAVTDVPGKKSYSTLLLSRIEEGKIEQLTVYPEKIWYLRQAGVLQIQNRFGLFRTDRSLSKIQAIDRFPAFVNGRQIQTGKIIPVQPSPNGRYILYFRSESAAYGNLVLFDTLSKDELTIAEDVELSVEGPPAKWSPDSDFFVYERSGEIYYFSIEQYNEGRVLDQELRRFADGGINKLYWGRNGALYFLQNSLLYYINSEELFTRSLYKNLLNIGTIIGKLPFRFDPNFDQFWISSNGDTIAFNKSGRNLFIFPLEQEDFSISGDIDSLPYLLLPRNTALSDLIWSSDGLLTILTTEIRNGSERSSIFRLDLTKDVSQYSFEQEKNQGVFELALSPDQNYIALLDANGLEIRDYRRWELKKRVSYADPLHVIWKDNENLILAGEESIKNINYKSGESSLLSPSQLDDYAFSEGGERVEGRIRGEGVVWTAREGWRSAGGISLSEPSGANDTYRVFLEDLYTGSYKNIVMLRKVKEVGTEALFFPPERRYEAFTDTEESPVAEIFSHGSRLRRREISLVFNAIDTVEGLRTVLDSLSDFGIKANFFINGEFMRRHPGAVQEIAQTGHEVGSLFHNYFDMTDTRFQITKEFIKEGLARNEDEYYQLTGRELSPIWHAPYYFSSPMIIEAGKEAGYRYVGRDVDSLDWVAKLDDNGLSRLYLPAADLVERIIEKKKPGSVISFRVGIPGKSGNGGREDYLFNSLDLLINELIARGYHIVTVSELMEHAK